MSLTLGLLLTQLASAEFTAQNAHEQKNLAQKAADEYLDLLRYGEDGE